MYYRLSNTAEVDVIEGIFDLPFKYPLIHLANPLINGLEEESLPIITSNNPYVIQYGIWGILPEGYKEDWVNYQKTQNTLNLKIEDLQDSKIFTIEKRCVFIVTGFFFSYEYEGEVYPFYAYPANKQPFALAGIYNTTYEGFITGSLILGSLSPRAEKYNNISNTMPIVLNSDNYMAWLGDEYEGVLQNNLSDYERLNFKAHAIAKEFYKNDIIFESILEPTAYKALSTEF